MSLERLQPASLHQAMETCRLQSKHRGVNNDKNHETIKEIYLICLLISMMDALILSFIKSLLTPQYNHNKLYITKL